jgi:carbonic anhydrase/acetyltransferase-like protein (isoleucine patch superfamily)
MLIDYLHHRPALAAPYALDPTAAVIGRAVAGPGLTLRAYATVRADGEAVRIGARAFFAERATVHIADGKLPAIVGDDVSVGRYALVHACTLEDRVVVGDAAVVMDGAVVCAGALIAPGALVPPRKTLPGGWIYAGNPATPLREIAPAELATAADAIREGRGSELVRGAGLPPLDMEPFLPGGAGGGTLHPIAGRAPRVGRAFVAPTAIIAGDVALGDDAGVFFGCALAAGGGRIVVGAASNVQDNSILAPAGGGELVIGAGVTIGHNVRMGAGTIGDGALIGMGSELRAGVVVEPGGCVGARAEVERGTVVRAGWIWAGRPAVAFRAIKPDERAWFAHGRDVYVGYARHFRGEPATAANGNGG